MTCLYTSSIVLTFKDRNVRYQRAIEEAIKEKHASGEEAHVVDIGTGPGLLTLIAAQAGSNSVTTLEGNIV
jgi:protein arginine N-methyltransferase 7